MATVEVMSIGKMLDEKAAATPETGFNLVGVDDFEAPGQKLYIIAWYETRAEAEARLAEHAAREDHNGDALYVYPGSRETSRPVPP